MFQIDYQLSAEWNRQTGEVNLSQADELCLRYNVLLGDVRLFVDGVDLGTNFGWVPVIDFAVSLRRLVNELEGESNIERCFDFTESDVSINFIRHGDSVTIKPNYTAKSGIVPFTEFASTVYIFASRLRNELSARFPELEKNAAFLSLMRNGE